MTIVAQARSLLARHTPIYAGVTPVTPLVPGLLHIAINGHPYAVDLKEYRRQSVPPRRDAMDTAREPGEHSLSTVGLWTRSGSDWSLGAGQEYYDRGDENDEERRRFLSSYGWDPWRRDRLALLAEPAQKLATAASNLKILSTGTHLYLVDGTDLKWTADPTVTPIAPTTVAAGNSILDVASDGAYVYGARAGVALGRTAIGSGVFAAFGAFVADTVGYVNGRLLAAKDNRVVELDNAGATPAGNLDYSHWSPDLDWTAIRSSPHGAYLLGTTGQRSGIYFVTADKDTGGLTKPTFVGGTAPGEIIYDLAYHQGVMLVGTSRGLRLGPVNPDSGAVDLGSVIEIPGGVRDLEPEGEYCWFTWTNPDTGRTGTGRAHLGRFTDTFVPAYAVDVCMAGLQGTVSAVARHGGRVYFGVLGAGYYGATAQLCADAKLDTGWIRYGTFESKMVASIDLRHEPLDGTIVVQLALENGTVMDVGQAFQQSSLGPGGFAVSATVGEAFRLIITGARSATDPLKGPVLRRWSINALVTPKRAEVFTLPIIMRETVTAGPGQDLEYGLDPKAEFRFLKGLELAGTPTTLQEGDEAYTGWIEGCEAQPIKWIEDGRFYEHTLVTTFVSTTDY